MPQRKKKKRKIYKLRVIMAVFFVLIILSITNFSIKSLTNGGKDSDVAVVQNDVETVKQNGNEQVTDDEGNPVTVEVTTEEPTTETATEAVIPNNQKMIALTFDDGPGPYTMRLLQILEKYNAKATFFMCGYSLERNDTEEILKKMEALGCDLGNHTMNHKQLDKIKAKKIRKEVNGVSEIIKSYVGHNPKFVRPPYGAGIKSKKVIENVGYPMICWNVDSLDWKTKSKKKTIKNVLRDAGDGDIVLMHDIHEWTVDAVEKIIPKLQKQGYHFVTVSEMAKARNVELKNGQAYFSFEP
jgi:peptidoglycan/xylan/chitin deacetylase (PgdA/CDA1 family)